MCNSTGKASALAAHVLGGRYVRRKEGDGAYRLPIERDYATVFAAQKAVANLREGRVPDEPLPPIGTLGFRVQRYGMLTVG